VHLKVEDLAAFALKLLAEVHCDLVDVEKAQTLVFLLEQIQAGKIILVMPEDLVPGGASANPVPPGALQ
jgi:hypothetical protein